MRSFGSGAAARDDFVSPPFLALRGALLLGATVVTLGATPALAQSATAATVAGQDPAASSPSTVEGVVVTGKRNEEIGTVVSASAGRIGGIELSERPLLRPGEVLESVPGMIVTAHTGGGKANQYYLRGFSLDHGTDFATSVDGVPVNLGTHAHGQGYLDLNWLIPELISGVVYKKGPYYAESGDFSAAGSANISYLSELPSNLLQLEAGTDNYGRALLAGSTRLGPGTLLYAGEYLYYDSPYKRAAEYQRPNGILKYTVGDTQVGGGITLQAYDARWFGSDQLPSRVIPSLPGGRFGSLDPLAGGHTYRDSIYGEYHWGRGKVTSQVELYAVKYGLNLYSDFTYFLDQDNGDEIRQYDNRFYVGGAFKTAISGNYLGQRTIDEFGLVVRSDFVNTELDHTAARVLINSLRRDQTTINNEALYWANTVVWAPWLRTNLGLRADAYSFDLTSDNPANSGQVTVARPEPKIGVTLSPRSDLDFYAQAGITYRSNDARGIFDTVPAGPTGSLPQQRIKPVVRSEGAEVGARVRVIPGLTSTVAFWYLQSNSELFFSGDSGTVDDTDRPGHRYGIELNNIYKPFRWLLIDADYAISQAFFSDHRPDLGDQIPEAIKTSASAAVTIHDLALLPKLTASLRLRYLGPRDLTPDGSVHSADVTVFNARLTYDVTSRIVVGLQVLNLFDKKYNDAEYYYETRLKGEPANPDVANFPDGGYNDHEIHAGEPREIRGSLAVKF